MAKSKAMSGSFPGVSEADESGAPLFAHPPAPSPVASGPTLDSAVKSLVTALYLYPNYRVDSRGPYGLVLDAIQAIDPGAAATLRSLGADAYYEMTYREDESEPSPPAVALPRSIDLEECASTAKYARSVFEDASNAMTPGVRNLLGSLANRVQGLLALLRATKVERDHAQRQTAETTATERNGDG